MNESDRIIATLSDAELVIWHARFGFERLGRRQRERVNALVARERRPDGQPRPLTVAPKTEVP